jgi:ABC-type transporter Mla subunit MlaD
MHFLQMENLIRMIVDEKLEKVINNTNTLKTEIKQLDEKLNLIIQHLQSLVTNTNKQHKQHNEIDQITKL